MSFLYPVFLLGALAVAVPIVLHLLKRDVAPEVPFPAVRLLQHSPLAQTRRRRVRDLVLLAARVSALLLLAAAFARPYLAAYGDLSRVHIVAIDRSYSMGAPGQFERALALAREALDGTMAGQPAAVIAFDDRADVIAEPGSRAAAREALAGLRPGYGSTRYATLVEKALELAGPAPARLTVVTDMQRAGWRDAERLPLPATIELDLRDVQGPPSNLAVASAVRSAGGVIATVYNSGPEPISGTARLLLDERVVTASPYTAAPGAGVQVELPATLPARGAAAIEIDDGHGYAADDRRYLLLDQDARIRVLIAGSDSRTSGFYVTRALLAGDGEHAVDVQHVPAASIGSLDPGALRQYGGVVLLSTRNLDRGGRDNLAAFARAGGGLLLAAGPEIDRAVLAALLGIADLPDDQQASTPAVLAATDLRHPVFRPIAAAAANLGQIRFTRSWEMSEDGWSVPARFGGGLPALLERRLGEGTVLLFASDLDRQWNDFPLHPAYAPFVLEAVRYVAGGRSTRRELLIADAPASAGGTPGVHAGADGRTVVVNVDAGEGAIARMEPEEFREMLPIQARSTAGAAVRQAVQVEQSQSLWRYGLLLMLIVLVAESAVGRVRHV